MKLIVFGAGGVLFDIVMQLHQSNLFQLIALGVDKSNFNSGKQLYEFSIENNIPFLNHYYEIEKFDFDYVLLFSYPPLIQGVYLNKFKFLNIHFAPLPKFRGFHGFIWSIINGEEKTGYTLHQVSEGIDNGPVYYQYLTDISSTDDVITIQKRIEIDIIHNLVLILLEIYEGKRKPIKQEEKNAIYVCKRKPEDGLIDWQWSKKRVNDFVRALKPPFTPGAFTFFKGEKLVIKSANIWDSPDYFSTEGQVVAKIPDSGVLVKCGDGVILVKTVIYKETEMNAFDLFKTVGARFSNKPD